MKKLLRIVGFFVAILYLSSAKATLLISEAFEGPYALNWWNEASQMQTYTDFVGSGFNNGFADAKSIISKETSNCHSGSNCIRLYTSSHGGTAEYWTNAFNPQPSELWITWWEKLSIDTILHIKNKWLLVQLGPDYNSGEYLNWQTWDGSTPNNLASRVYNPYIKNATFAPSTSINLPLGQWYQYKVHVKLNTIGQSDGIWQVWVKLDGVNWINLWNLSNIVNRSSNNNIIALRFGGTRDNEDGSGSGLSSSGIKWQDDIKIGTTEADVDSGGGGESNFLAAPNDLHTVNN